MSLIWLWFSCFCLPILCLLLKCWARMAVTIWCYMMADLEKCNWRRDGSSLPSSHVAIFCLLCTELWCFDHSFFPYPIHSLLAKRLRRLFQSALFRGGRFLYKKRQYAIISPARCKGSRISRTQPHVVLGFLRLRHLSTSLERHCFWSNAVVFWGLCSVTKRLLVTFPLRSITDAHVRGVSNRRLVFHASHFLYPRIFCAKVALTHDLYSQRYSHRVRGRRSIQ